MVDILGKVQVVAEPLTSITAGEFVQSSVVAEEPEEVAGEKGHYPEGSIQKKLIPVVAGESAPTSVEKLTSEEQTAKLDVPAIAKDPEPVFIVDQVTADTDEVVLQESSLQEPLAIAPQANSEKETAPVRPALVEASPDETTVEVALAIESDPPEQHDLEDQVPAALIPIFPSEALEDEASEGNADVAVESTAEASPEGPLLVDPEKNAEVEPTASQEPLVGASEQKSVILVHEEIETEEAGKVQLEQSGPEEPDVILDPEEPAQHEPEPEKQQETVLIMSLEAEKDVEEHAEEAETAALVVVEENAEEPLASTTEEESVVLFPAELETEEGDRVEPAAEVTVLLESAMDSAKGEPDLEEQEETAPIFSVTEKMEAPEIHEKEVEAAVPVILEGNSEEDAATNKDLPPQEESVVFFPEEVEIEDEDQAEPTVDETVPQESAPEDPVVVASVKGELDLEERIDEDSTCLVSPEAPEEEAPDEHAKGEADVINVESEEVPVPIASDENAEEEPATDKEPPYSTPEEENAIVLVPAELDSEEECQETSAKCPKCKCKEETEPQESGPEDNTREGVEAVVQSDPLPHEPVLEEDTAPQETEPDDSDPPTPGVMEGTNGTRIKTHREDFKAAIKLIKHEPVAPVRRGAVLGAAFFTLMSFIIIGFVLITVSKKLR
ncbi:hypothetical protein PAMP_017544 [Pampus punctatissimus]